MNQRKDPLIIGLKQHEKERYPIHSYHTAKALALRRTSQGERADTPPCRRFENLQL